MRKLILFSILFGILFFSFGCITNTPPTPLENNSNIQADEKTPFEVTLIESDLESYWNADLSSMVCKDLGYFSSEAGLVEFDYSTCVFSLMKTGNDNVLQLMVAVYKMDEVNNTKLVYDNELEKMQSNNNYQIIASIGLGDEGSFLEFTDSTQHLYISLFRNQEFLVYSFISTQCFESDCAVQGGNLDLKNELVNYMQILDQNIEN